MSSFKYKFHGTKKILHTIDGVPLINKLKLYNEMYGFIAHSNVLVSSSNCRRSHRYQHSLLLSQPHVMPEYIYASVNSIMLSLQTSNIINKAH